jgi:hypothetical protein
MVFMNVQTYYSGRERGKEVETKEKVLIYYAVNILYVAITTKFYVLYYNDNNEFPLCEF